MLDSYLQILIESLEKKREVLYRIESLNEEQAESLKQEIVDKVAFDKSMEEKQKLIDKLNQLDDGFEKTYELIKTDIVEKKDSYKDQLLQLKELISQVVEKGISIKAQEERIKRKLDNMFHNEYKRLNQKRMAYKVSKGYYQNMRMINYIDPQLMDRKK